MAALCKAPTKSAGIGLSITVVCKNAGKKTLGQDDFFVVYVWTREGFPPPPPAVGPNNKRVLVLYKYLNLAHEKLNLVPKMPFKTMKEPKKPHK